MVCGGGVVVCGGGVVVCGGAVCMCWRFGEFEDRIHSLPCL